MTGLAALSVDRPTTVSTSLNQPSGSRPVSQAVTSSAGGGSGFRRLREGGAVACKALEPASVYVSADGLVFPCCWLGNIRAATVTAAHPVLRLAAETGGLEALRVPPRTLEEVVEGPFFARVAASWACPSVAEGRLATCANVCGGGRPLRG